MDEAQQIGSGLEAGERDPGSGGDDSPASGGKHGDVSHGCEEAALESCKEEEEITALRFCNNGMTLEIFIIPTLMWRKGI